MPYPDDKITRPRTVTDAIWAIVVKGYGHKRHCPPSSVGVGKLNYVDQRTGTGTQAVEISTLVDGPLALGTAGQVVRVATGAATWQWATLSGGATGIIRKASTAATGAVWGSITPAPNGARTTFEVPDAYVAGSLTVSINGVQVRPTDGYTESDPAAKQFTTTVAPFTTDVLDAKYVVAI